MDLGAGDGIRTHEHLRDWTLNPAPLTWLGNPRKRGSQSHAVVVFNRIRKNRRAPAWEPFRPPICSLAFSASSRSWMVGFGFCSPKPMSFVLCELCASVVELIILAAMRRSWIILAHPLYPLIPPPLRRHQLHRQLLHEHAQHARARSPFAHARGPFCASALRSAFSERRIRLCGVFVPLW
jgi:hypothetical protein